MKRSPLRIILIVAFVDLIGFGLIIPLQAVYARRLGATGLTFGLLVGAYAAMQLIFNPLLGRWSDRVGRRRILLLSVTGSVLSHVLLGVADLAQSLPLLFAARILDGITGANIITAQAYIADVTSVENRARGMGLFGAAFGLGFVVGPALAALLAAVGTRISGEQAGTSWPAFGAATIALGALHLIWRYLPESRTSKGTTDLIEPSERHPLHDDSGPSARAKVRGSPQGNRLGSKDGRSNGTYGLNISRLRQTMANPRFREQMVMVFSATFAFVMLEVSLVYLCMSSLGVSTVGSGLIFAYFGITMAMVQGGLLGRLVPRFGEPRLVSVAPFLTAIGFLMLAAMPFASTRFLAWSLLLVGCLPTVLGHGLTGPNLSALVSRQASGDRQGVTLGLSQSTGSLARTLAPPLGGMLFDRGASWPYVAGAALLVGLGFYAMSVRSGQEAALSRTTDLDPT